MPGHWITPISFVIDYQRIFLWYSKNILFEGMMIKNPWIL